MRPMSRKEPLALRRKFADHRKARILGAGTPQ
jgi:hypothetical protein